MMNGKNFTIAIVCSLTFLFASQNAAVTKKLGSPAARTGSPGDGTGKTCAMSGCHVGTINAFPGSINIDVSDIPASGYVSGESYTIGVTVAESGRISYGFQLTAEDGSGSKLGSYLAMSGSKIVSANWITHTSPNGSGTWTFDWIAPAGNSTVIFYAMGNAANGNNSASGDHIYASNISVQKDLLSSVADHENTSGIRIWNVPGGASLFIDTEETTSLLIFNMAGELISTHEAKQGRSEIDISALRGIHLITDAKTLMSHKFVAGY